MNNLAFNLYFVNRGTLDFLHLTFILLPPQIYKEKMNNKIKRLKKIMAVLDIKIHKYSFFHCVEV